MRWVTRVGCGKSRKWRSLKLNKYAGGFVNKLNSVRYWKNEG